MKNSEKIIPILSFFWLLTLLSLGVWWMYIIERLGHQINDLHSFISGHSTPVNLTRMIYWEGGFFLLLTTILTITLATLFLKDHKKNRAIHSFFASIAHEVKNPLASIKLQADMLKENPQLCQKNPQRFQNYIQHIEQSTLELEEQINNLLQLSRIELDAPQNLTPLDFKVFLNQLIKQPMHPSHIHLVDNIPGNHIDIWAEDTALKVIFKNLLENSKRHASQQPIYIELDINNKLLRCTYTNKTIFNGDKEKLGNLFYKHNSPHGSGIGIYLIKKLMSKLGGKLEISFTPYLSFSLYFRLVEVNYDK